ncbi:MAG: choice-of-anchor E domain-containing protein [Verrucomicrobiota bacterium]
MSRTTARCFCRNLFACVVPLLVIAGTACAQDKTKTFTSEALTTSGSFTLPEFDTSLGTLQDISLTLTVNSLTTIQVFNNSGTPETFTDASLSSTDIVVVPGTVRLTSVTDVTEPAGTAQPGLNTLPVSRRATPPAVRSAPTPSACGKTRPAAWSPSSMPPPPDGRRDRK